MATEIFLNVENADRTLAKITEVVSAIEDVKNRLNELQQLGLQLDVSFEASGLEEDNK